MQAYRMICLLNVSLVEVDRHVGSSVPNVSPITSITVRAGRIKTWSFTMS